MKILLTGVAGFIGYHLAKKLLAAGETIYGIDNLNSYYDVNLKKARLNQLRPHRNFKFEYLDLIDNSKILEVFQTQKFDCVVHLAAQAGVRYSLQNPQAYIDSNLIGFNNIIEACRHYPVQHFVFASSSSVYGANRKIPFSTNDVVDHPISLYAATKKANELIAHSYSHLYNLPVTGLRFFTVYGPWGRPDMAYFKFVQAIAENRPIEIFNYGKMQRDFTYIDDIVAGVMRVIHNPPQQISSDTNINSNARYKIYNIGNNQPVELLHFIEVIEEIMGKKAQKKFLPMQPGDVTITYADIDDLTQDIGFKPSTSIEAGLEHFVKWYQDWVGINAA
jgi:UDP-glucuronate 4-epimerase